MARVDFETIRETINAVDLALSGIPNGLETDDPEQVALGVLDGVRVTLAAFAHPTLSVGEVLDNHIEGDVIKLLDDHDRVIGMLAGSVAIASLLGKSQA